MCSRCGHQSEYVGLDRFCVNPHCDLFLVGLNLNSRTCDLERFLVDEPGQIKCRDPAVFERVKQVLQGRKDGAYINTAWGWIENKED